MNLRFIVMHVGYVENSSTAALIYQCGFFGHPGYSSYKEAITNLALDLYTKFYDDRLSIYENRYLAAIKDCCRNSLIVNKGDKFCSECGHRISDHEFDAEEFAEYVYDLTRTTCDSYGDAEDTSSRVLTWYPYWTGDVIGAPKEEVIFIAESAEQVLLAALLDAKPELKNDSLEDFECQDWESFKNNKQPSYR